MKRKLKLETIKPQKSTEIETIRKKTTDVERALRGLETIWKMPAKTKDISKWQKAVEEKLNYLTKSLFEVNHIVKENVSNIVEIKNVLRHNYENIKTISEILKHALAKDKKDKGAIFKTLKKKLPI